jgi:hypothetical protein
MIRKFSVGELVEMWMESVDRPGPSDFKTIIGAIRRLDPADQLKVWRRWPIQYAAEYAIRERAFVRGDDVSRPHVDACVSDALEIGRARWCDGQEVKFTNDHRLVDAFCKLALAEDSARLSETYRPADFIGFRVDPEDE